MPHRPELNPASSAKAANRKQISKNERWPNHLRKKDGPAIPKPAKRAKGDQKRKMITLS
jgi:hypothetical protein